MDKQEESQNGRILVTCIWILVCSWSGAQDWQDWQFEFILLTSLVAWRMHMRLRIPGEVSLLSTSLMKGGNLQVRGAQSEFILDAGICIIVSNEKRTNECIHIIKVKNSFKSYWLTLEYMPRMLYIFFPESIFMWLEKIRLVQIKKHGKKMETMLNDTGVDKRKRKQRPGRRPPCTKSTGGHTYCYSFRVTTENTYLTLIVLQAVLDPYM